MNYDILMRDASFKECREYIRANFQEYYEVEPGFVLFEKHMIGVPPITIGLSGDVVIFPYTKPCYGTFLLRLECKEEADRLRALKAGRKK